MLKMIHSCLHQKLCQVRAAQAAIPRLLTREEEAQNELRLGQCRCTLVNHRAGWHDQRRNLTRLIGRRRRKCAYAGKRIPDATIGLNQFLWEVPIYLAAQRADVDVHDVGQAFEG
jgi:hypothetical protein